MKEQLEAIRKAALEAVSGPQAVAELEALRVKYLGKKGELTALLKQMGGLSAELRPVMPMVQEQPGGLGILGFFLMLVAIFVIGGGRGGRGGGRRALLLGALLGGMGRGGGGGFGGGGFGGGGGGFGGGGASGGW